MFWLLAIWMLAATPLWAQAPGSWEPTADLQQPRAGHTATLLANGKVLIAGGTDASGHALATAELFDYATAQYVPVPTPLPVPVWGHTATLLTDGTVLMVGGTDDSGQSVPHAQLFEPSTRTFTLLSPLNTPRSQHTATLLGDGRVLIAGGTDGTGALARLDIYDPASRAFARAPRILSVPRQAHTATLLSDGRVLLVGGANASGALDSAELYDANAGTIAKAGVLNIARTRASAALLLDGTVLVAGGQGLRNEELDSAEVYDPATNAFTLLSVLMGTARSSHLGLTLLDNGKVLIAGGLSGGDPIASAEVYDPVLGEFWEVGSLSAARETFAANFFAAPYAGVLLASGGFDGHETPLDSAEVFFYPTLRSDKPDYPPGNTVTLMGEGWEPHEPVTITIHESSGDPDTTLTATADASGAFTNSQLQTNPDRSDIGVRFLATASGQRSNWTAQTTFTDGISVASYEATCSTQKTSFAVGETVCATASGLGNVAHQIQWFDPSNGLQHTSTNSSKGNLQDTFTPNATGTWTVKVFEVSGQTPVFRAQTTFTVAGPTKLSFTTFPFTIAIGQCSPTITVQSQNTSGTATNPTSNTTVNLSSTAAGGTFFSNNTCTTPMTSVMIPTTANSASFYYKDSTAGSPTINAAATGLTSASQMETIQKANQTIIFGVLANKTFGDPPFTVNATASSGLMVSFSTVGNCTVSGNTVTITGAGSCTVTASQAGNTNYNPASDVSQQFTIAKANQTISFGPLANKTFNDPDFSVSATASSGLAVSVTATGDCTVLGTTLHLTGAGSCTVTAHQAGDSNYNAAPDVSQLFTIAKADQSIAFGALANETYGDPDFSVAATTNSGLAVSFIATGNCMISGSSVHITGAGSCTVTASQTGSGNYNAATSISQTFNIAKATPTITVASGLFSYDSNPHAATGTLVGVKGEDLGPLTFTYNGGSDVPVNAGTYAVVASFAGNANYNAASNSSASIVINKAQATISLSDLLSIYDGTPKAATATTNPFGLSGVSITYNGSPLPPINPGSYAVVASLTNLNYQAANAIGTFIIVARPVAESQDVTTDEDMAKNITLSATDLDSAGLGFSIISDPSHGTLAVGAASCAPSGAGSSCTAPVTYTPEPNYNGSDSFAFTASDGSLESSATTVTITVNAVNDRPTADNQTVTTPEDTPVAMTLTGSDVETPAASLTVTVTVPPLHGTLSGKAPHLLYTPDADYNGPDQFLYIVTDTGDGPSPALSSASATVSITVTAVNDPPIAADDSKTTSEDTPLTFPASDLLVNDAAGPANESDQVLAVIAVGSASHGTVTLNPDGTITYTPAANYNGPDSFTYTMQDDGMTNGAADPKTVTTTVYVTVMAVNDAPTAANSNASTAEDTPLTLAIADLLANDAPGPSDESGQSLTIVAVSQAQHGTVVLDNAHAVIVYSPHADYFGPDSFTYTIQDNGTSDGLPDPKTATATVSITVTEANDPPLAADDVKTTREDTPLTFSASDLLVNDTAGPANESGQTLTVIAVEAGPETRGTVVLRPDGTITYTPAPNSNGPAIFTYTIMDNGTTSGEPDPQTATGTVHVTVVAVNDPPVVAKNLAMQTVQYSDPIAPVSISAIDIDSPPTALVATTSWKKQGDPTFTTTPALPDGLMLMPDTPGLWSLEGSALAAPGSYVVRVTVSDGQDVSFTDIAITVTPEDARATYTGTTFARTSSATSSQVSVTLRATIQDITAVDPAADGYAGEIRNATVRFVDRATNAALCTTTVALVDPSDAKTGTATCNWAADIGNASSASLTVGIVIENYYTRNSPDDNAIVNVSKPLNDFITGGGYLVLSSSAGQLTGEPGTKSNFGFNAKYNKNGTNLQGNANLIVRSHGRIYQIKSNAITSLGVDPSKGRAELSAKANIQDITNPAAPIAIDGNATLQLTMTDKGEPGSADTIGITLWNKTGGLWYSSDWNGASTAQHSLDGGNLVVH